ncbi:Autophagy-related protein 27 [Komagataella phaffii CBS 7435]|uniref:Autophagy-related protein 27 n=2 Tax=Komagataella phaffii TaxID=460519 RepID=C4R2U3_KOMPG|nr:Type I membrane protein involved in autophagy and the cytoplasm-to-vacuole targeting (Cvt) pathway [Komagataella phaffii GS115]AOA62253.1 GQ67_01237T0 [Komagataella phaffii]CAH2447626.1 Autophagy-related protein 27 [Komagataella phaffii CBS 7435]AOA67883.1 GQ68_00153T0 [Komagataella phaffii GS115]CAY69817.1 Type I membrane protein involved in autophagy and the cytoplasm-to-vacuole targeting (Cvt) pathway [Komagataella phaffii GS115]CCA37812.1 Autophagy-related protein 27 [Komagataella phaff
MNYFRLILFIASVCAIDISNKHLRPYDLNKIAGLHEVTTELETPPSITKSVWYLNIYDSQDKDGKDKMDVENCPDDSQICGITEVLLNGKEPVVSEVVAFSRNLKPSIETNDNNVTVQLTGAYWGKQSIAADIVFECSKDGDYDKDLLELVGWNRQQLELRIKSKAACRSDNKGRKDDKNKDKDKDGKHDSDSDGSWGWFTWFFILGVIGFAAYIIGTAWLNVSNRGSSNEAFSEFVDAVVEVVSRIPGFLRELAGKIFGSSNRGGYSAV